MHKPGCPSPFLCNCYPTFAELSIWRVRYITDIDQIAYTLPQTYAEALKVKNSLGDDCKAEIQQVPNSYPVYKPPTCGKCGSQKVSDLFKGEYCPRCNDWC